MRNRHLSAQVRDAIDNDDRFEIVPASQIMLDRGTKLYDQRPDKNWSLTDCLSFLVMEECGIVDALTADHHFEQAGFRAIMK